MVLNALNWGTGRRGPMGRGPGRGTLSPVELSAPMGLEQEYDILNSVHLPIRSTPRLQASLYSVRKLWSMSLPPIFPSPFEPRIFGVVRVGIGAPAELL